MAVIASAVWPAGFVGAVVVSATVGAGVASPDGATTCDGRVSLQRIVMTHFSTVVMVKVRLTLSNGLIFSSSTMTVISSLPLQKVTFCVNRSVIILFMAVITPEAFHTFGALLAYLRKRAYLTQDELSRAVGYSRAHVTRLKRINVCRISPPSPPYSFQLLICNTKQPGPRDSYNSLLRHMANPNRSQSRTPFNKRL